jgi:DNA-binding transcriptional regulator YbjK
MQDAAAGIQEAGLPKGERSRRALREATLRVIARGGIEAVTHRRVAAEAGVSHGATTYHFTSRDDLILQAFRHYIRLITAHLDAAWEDLDDRKGGVASVVAFLVDFTRRELSDPELVHAEYELIVYAARNEELAREYRAWQRNLVSGLAPVLEACGAARPAEAARIVVAVCRAFELEQLTHPGSGPDQLRQRLDLLLSGLVGSPEPSRSSGKRGSRARSSDR